MRVCIEKLGNGDWAVTVWHNGIKIEDHIFKSLTVEDVRHHQRAYNYFANYDYPQL
jgi:hypothetical protein